MTHLAKILPALLLPLSAVALPACGDDNEGSCERIVEKCHPLDKGPGAIHDCHEFAEAQEGDDDKCADKEDSCFETCK
jgi:hypothetical protein